MTKEGTVTVEGNRWILRFERELQHPPQTVWSKLTDTEQMKSWLSKDATVDLRVGGAIKMNDHQIDSTIVALDPPRVLEFGWSGPFWDGGTVRWELEPTDTGTRLVLVHSMDAMSEADAKAFKDRYPYDLPEGWEPLPSTLAGWHSILDALDSTLAGKDVPEDMSKWLGLNERYKEQVGATRS